MIHESDIYQIGVIGKAHGVKGELAFNFTDDVFDRVDADYLIIRTDGIPVPFFIEEYRFKSNSVAIMKFEGIDDEAHARRFTSCPVYFPKALSDADPDELRWSDFEGYTIISADSGAVGTVKSVDDSTENVLFYVTAPDGSELLIPAAEDWIEDIDHDNRSLTMQLPPGLLTLC